MKMRLLDLFSGIGGFSLGLERSSYFETVQFCEIDPYCRRVLAKHWPKVPCHDDVRTLDISRIDGRIDAICGGFPCQDISISGKRAGIDGKRSGLWSEFDRIIGDVRPKVVIVENVTNLLDGPSIRPGAWFGRVLRDLAARGYDAEWKCLPLGHFGAPNERDRVWIVAYPKCEGLPRPFLEWESLRGAAGETSTKFGNRVVPCGLRYAERFSDLRMGDGIPSRLVRPAVKAYGNAVGPDAAEGIGRLIGQSELFLTA